MSQTQLEKSLQEFIQAFRWVFEQDWTYTEEILTDKDMIHYYISASGNFLNPDCDDESNNWANRGHLLAAYRKLLKDCREAGIDVEIG